MAPVMIEPDVKTRRWRRAEYERLVDLGVFVGERLELLDGLLVVREPQASAHAAIMAHVAQVLAAAFGPAWHPRLHSPLALDDDSEPEPDVAIVAGAPRDYARAHPSTAALVVEIADSSLRLDRRLKGGLYARAGLADYWIVNLVEGGLEVHRGPARASRGGLEISVRRDPASARERGGAGRAERADPSGRPASLIARPAAPHRRGAEPKRCRGRWRVTGELVHRF